jgi:hypothetical protein
MRVHMIIRRSVALLAVALLSLLAASPAAAHGHIIVGDYELVIGFRGEPALQGEPNGLDLRVTNTKTGEPVSGLEESLSAEISFGGSTQPLELRARWGEEGAYTADILPTAAGDYSFHIFGDIAGTPVDETMTSSPDTFSSVGTKAAISFPAAEPTTAELQSEIAAARQQSLIALVVGGAGALLGLAGVAFGLSGRQAGRAAAVATSGRRA